MILDEFEFGFADAEKEYNRIPDIFDNSFYDSKNVIDKLINKHQFIVVGRKGVGKSAVNSKIRYIADNSSKMVSFSLQLNDFEYSTFAKTNIDKNSMGTQKYKDSWEFVLLTTLIKIQYNEDRINNNKIEGIVDILENLGFSIKNDLNFKKTITRLSKIKVGGDKSFVGLEIDREKNDKSKNFREFLADINDNMLDAIKSTNFDGNRIFITIDGIDDILRIKNNQIDILSGLIRSIDYLNENFFSNDIPVKIIISIREDILSNMTDPDLNKIKRDGSINIDWSLDKEGLREIIRLRFQYSGLSEEKAENYWYKIIPKRIKDKDSWEHVLEYTLLKPRDILQFLKTCQDLFPNSQFINFKETNQSIKSYSKDYFIEEMKNEVTGFVNDKLITLLPSIFQRIGSNKFTLSDFYRHYSVQGDQKQDEDEIKHLLILLYESGYVGQLIPTRQKRGATKYSVIFKYRNPSSQIDLGQTFIVHKGIQAGLGVRTS